MVRPQRNTPESYDYDTQETAGSLHPRRDQLKARIQTTGEKDYAPERNKAMRDEGHASDHGEKVLHAGKRELAAVDIVKLAGLLAFFAVLGAIAVLAWPVVSDIFEEGGLELLIQRMRQAGPAGVGILLALQLLQVVVAFIPGEVVQVAAGLLYGPLGGTAIVLVGAVGASALVYQLVHVLGAPFVRAMVSDSFLDRFRAFEKSGKLNIIVFVLFLIPGLPKDLFTYVVGLTDMKLGTFLALSTLGRAPGVFVSSLAASNIMSGDYLSSAVMFGVLAVLAALGVLFRDRIMEFFSR